MTDQKLSAPVNSKERVFAKGIFVNNGTHFTNRNNSDRMHLARKFNCHVNTALNLPLDAAFFFEKGSAPVKIVLKSISSKNRLTKYGSCGIIKLPENRRKNYKKWGSQRGEGGLSYHSWKVCG